MDLPKLNSILGHADLARAMRTMTELELRQLAVNSIEWALGQCQVDPLQFARPLDAILLDNSNAGNVDWESLRALADELDEQVDIHNESFAHGPPESTESAKFQLKFQLARMLAALCEGGDRTRPTLDSTAWCLYEVSFAVGQPTFDSYIKTLRTDQH
ncbi:hypothetical protein [Deinococcus indicus]|uniref:hypothetical protein n=1 Tax=Deinococcus indicus TaxID=223556 RepID=UPI0011778044|nr:hypothetical protein [Deinococcus indicus]